MKLNKMINTLSIAAVALLATACNDTDAQYTITEVGAPEFTVSEPSVVDDVLLFGERTIRKSVLPPRTPRRLRSTAFL